MANSWRPGPRRPFHGNACPICSLSHFPFCLPPHPLSLDQNPRFRSHNSSSFQRPFFDPFIDHPDRFMDHPRPNMNLHRSFVENPGDRFGDPPPWHRNPSLEYRSFHGKSQIGDSINVNGYYDDSVAPSRYDHGGVGLKRVKLDEMHTSSFVNDIRMNSSRFSMDDERRLKLIRDHGGVPTGVPDDGGVSPGTGLGVDFDHEPRGYLQENRVLDRPSDSIGGLVRGRFDDLRGGRNDMALKSPTNYGMDDYRESRYSDLDRKGTSLHQETEFDSHNYGDEHGLAFGQQNLQSYRREVVGQSEYGLGEKLLLQTSGHIGLLAGHSSDVVQGGQGQVAANPYHDGGIRDYSTLGSSHPSGWHGLSSSSALYLEQRSSFKVENSDPSHHLPQPYEMQNPMQLHHDVNSHASTQGGSHLHIVNVLSNNVHQGPVGHQKNMPTASLFSSQHFTKKGGHESIPYGFISENMTLMQASRVFNVQPPLPVSPPPPLPTDPPRNTFSEPHALCSPVQTSSSLFPITVSSAASMPSSYLPIPQAHPLARPYFHDQSHLHSSPEIATEEFQAILRTSSTKYLAEGQSFPLLSLDNPKVVDACQIFKQPHRASRPDHVVIILRGLPGSGKSYLAKILRDLEVDNGGDAPRIHSMDDYFMTEVDKVEESDVSKFSGSVRGKKPVVKKVMEYFYEPEMEEAYRLSMLKAFKKTLDEGAFSFVIVDDRNLRVADFAQFWATAKRSGYEVYLLEATYKDPAGCAARNVHGFTQDDIQKMAGQWEEAPSLYLKLDVKSLFQGDDSKESGIQEVDMDTGDGESAGTLPGPEERNLVTTVPGERDYSLDGCSKDYKKWDGEEDHQREVVKELGRSKWSNDLHDDTGRKTDGTERNLNALSGLVKAYAKEGKSVHWGDQVGSTGFSIGAARKVHRSLLIGPGAGYTLKSNPLPKENVSNGNGGESKSPNVFQERIRAERESFRVVFDKRRQRIGRLDLEDE